MSAIHRTARWAKFTKTVRPQIEASLPLPCVEGCGKPVMPGQAWDLSHIISHALDPFQPLTPQMVGPGHRSCNRRSGAKLGRAMQLRRKAEDQKLPSEGSGW